MNISLAVILSTLSCVSCIGSSDWIFNYQFSGKVGQVLDDWNTQNHAVNGYTAEVETGDIIWTDRGGYFDGSTLITPPSNSIVLSQMGIPESFTIEFWSMIISDGMIFSRFDSSNNIMISISVSSGIMNFWGYTSNQPFPGAVNNGPNYSITYNEWHYVVGTLKYNGSTTTEKLYIESNSNSVSENGSYNNNGDATGTHIGCDPACTAGFTGYFYFMRLSSIAYPTSDLGTEYSTSCSGSCSICPQTQTPTCISTCANPQYPDSCSTPCNCPNNAIASCSDSDVNVCIMCDSSCSRTCSGLTSNDCQDITLYCWQYMFPYSPTQKACLWWVTCSANCYYCEVSNTCIECKAGYYLDNTGACTSCDSSCKHAQDQRLIA